MVGRWVDFLNYIPDIILEIWIVFDATLRKSRNIVLHSYDNGICPGENRIKIRFALFKIFLFGTSEDGAI